MADKKIPLQTSVSKTDSQASCMRRSSGQHLIVYCGNIHTLHGKPVPKTEPMLLYSCPCDGCIEDLHVMKLFN